MTSELEDLEALRVRFFFFSARMIISCASNPSTKQKCQRITVSETRDIESKEIKIKCQESLQRLTIVIKKEEIKLLDALFSPLTVSCQTE